jgi:hypothetical protein
MTVDKVRHILWEEYADLPDEHIQDIIKICRAIARYAIENYSEISKKYNPEGDKDA